MLIGSKVTRFIVPIWTTIIEEGDLQLYIAFIHICYAILIPTDIASTLLTTTRGNAFFICLASC